MDALNKAGHKCAIDETVGYLYCDCMMKAKSDFGPLTIYIDNEAYNIPEDAYIVRVRIQNF
jgi:hypothetical protein